LGDGAVWAQTSDDRIRVIPAIGKLFFRRNERSEKFRVCRETESRLGRHYADDGIRLGIKRNGSAENSGIGGERVSPQGIAENHRTAAGLHIL
jgi:hypothetical protein